MEFISIQLLFLFVVAAIATSGGLPIRLEVNVALNSRSANVHLSQEGQLAYPFTVTYGACHSSTGQHEAHHTVSTVHAEGVDRLVWVLPEDIATEGCLSAWSAGHQLVGRSEPLNVHKNSRQWMNKRRLDNMAKLSKRASIPMTNASGIDAEGPWFDGVQLLKEKEIGAVSVQQAKAKSRCSFAKFSLRSRVLLSTDRNTQRLPLWELVWLA